MVSTAQRAQSAQLCPPACQAAKEAVAQGYSGNTVRPKRKVVLPLRLADSEGLPMDGKKQRRPRSEHEGTDQVSYYIQKLISAHTLNMLPNLQTLRGDDAAHDAGCCKHFCVGGRSFAATQQQNRCALASTEHTCSSQSDGELTSHESPCATGCSLLCQRAKSSLASLSPVLQMQDARSKDGIATSKVWEAVKRIKKPAVLNALFANTKHKELTQGTSGNENWHSWLRRTIAILGGMRGLAMIQKFLAWQMMRFNEAVRAARRKSAQKSAASSGVTQMKAQDKQLWACKQAFASALCGGESERHSRQAYHNWMHTSYDLEMMLAMGFSEAKPRYNPSQWSDEEVTAMLECLRGLASREESIHVADPFYFISHHTLLRQKTPDQVKALLSYVDKHYSAE